MTYMDDETNLKGMRYHWEPQVSTTSNEVMVN